MLGSLSHSQSAKQAASDWRWPVAERRRVAVEVEVCLSRLSFYTAKPKRASFSPFFLLPSTAVGGRGDSFLLALHFRCSPTLRLKESISIKTRNEKLENICVRAARVISLVLKIAKKSYFVTWAQRDDCVA
jgi:hypothetical protein